MMFATLTPLVDPTDDDRTPPWHADAACRGYDPELFYAERGTASQVLLAKQVCADCPVRADCLAYALDAGERFGIWGGLAPKERARVRPKLRVRVCAECGEPFEWTAAFVGGGPPVTCSDECRQQRRRRQQTRHRISTREATA